MTRHINLMQADMLPGHGRLQLPAFMGVLVLALVGSAAWIALSWHQQQRLQDDLADWQQQVARSEQALRQARSVSPQLDTEAALIQENAELTRQKNARETAYSGLATQLGESARGFSTPLAQLSDIDFDGLWLSHIELRNSQQHLGLAGFARQPGLVPRYLSQLEGSVFRGISIQNLNIEQAPDDPSLWRFTLADSANVGAALNRRAQSQ
ncbi:PilN domain-containing protein [Saccharospirillum impatiens]|uniref:PilN domain-containing protein n=1 Tax=Saccharospirillum impatiens TaxID=169438 RepID=UPI00041FCE93|nr:PilN domain-containing protein [Saccharospirillum impatiens]